MVMSLGLLFLTVVSAFAGGWATIQINETPDEIRAGEPFTVEFTVWQHGDKPVHRVQWEGGKVLEITPRLELRNLETGETLDYVAEPMKQNGRYSVVMTLPAEGRWAWAMTLDPLIQEGELPDLTAQPASVTSGGAVALSAETPTIPSSGSWYYGLAVLAVVAVGGIGLFLLIMQVRNKQAPATQ